MALKKPSDFFGKKEEDSNLPVVESDNSLRDELSKVESLSEQVVQLQQELSQKVVKNDLESLVLSQINTMQENFDYLQKEFKQSNKKNIREFKDKVTELTNIIGNLVENEFPKYKKQITNNELRIGDKFDQLKTVVSENIVDIKEDIDFKIENIAFAIDENLESFEQRLQETSTEVKDTVNTYNKLSKIVESRISKENEQLEEYSKVIQSLYEEFLNLENSIKEDNTSNLQTIEDQFEVISLSLNGKFDNFNEDIGSFKNHISSEILDIKSDVVVFEKHNKDTEKLIQEFSEKLNKIPLLNESIEEVQTNVSELKSQYEDVVNQSSETKKDLEVVEKYIQNHHQDIEVLKEEVFSEIEKLPVGDLQENLNRLEKKIDYIKETYSKIEPDVLVKEVIKEGLLNIPSDEKNSDPLTPLNQNFVTLDQLQGHYRLFINRIQQQLATLGGGGETRLRFLDDVIGVATNPGAYDGKYLQWNSTTNTAEFTDVTGAGVQVNSDWGAVSGISSILNKPTIVNQIIAGTGITISPSNGIGTVTINATATGTGAATTGYYGSFYDTTTQSTTGAGVTTKVSLGITASTNGFYIANGTRIVAQNAGVYNTQFSFQLDKPSGSTSHIWIWLSKNGVDLPETNSVVAIQGTNAETISAWNFIVDMIAGDYIEYKWMSEDTNIQLTSTSGTPVTSIGNPPISVNIPAIPSAIVSIQQIAGVIAGVGSTTQTLNQTLQYGNTSSLGMSVGLVTATQLNVTGLSTFQNVVNITTAGSLSLGDNSDFQIYYSGSNSVIKDNGLGDLYLAASPAVRITNTNFNKTSAVFNDGGAAELYHNNSKTFETTGAGATVFGTLQSQQLNVSGVSTLGITTFTGNVSFGSSVFFGDNKNLNFGNNNNLQIYYNGANSYVDSSGGLIINGSSITYSSNTHSFQNASKTTTFAAFLSSGTAFYNNNNTKLQIIGAGITVTGTTFTDQLSVSGVTGVSTFSNGPVFIGAATSTGTASQRLQVTGGGYFSGNVGIGTTLSTEALSVLPKLQILNNSNADGRLILRAKPGNSYRWNIDNDGDTNNLRFFKEDDATAANGAAPFQITPTGNATLSGNLNAAGNYFVKVARTSSQTITAGSDTLIGFSTVSDGNGWFNASNNRITPTVAGNYVVTGMVNWGAAAATNTNQTNIQIRRNGTTVALSQVGLQTHAYTMYISAIVTLNGSTDYTEFTVYTANPTSQVVNGGADGTLTKLEMFKLN